MNKLLLFTYKQFRSFIEFMFTHTTLNRVILIMVLLINICFFILINLQTHNGYWLLGFAIILAIDLVFSFSSNRYLREILNFINIILYLNLFYAFVLVILFYFFLD